MIAYLNLIIAGIVCIACFVLRDKIQKYGYGLWKRTVVLFLSLLFIALLNVLSVGLISPSPNVNNRDIVFLVDTTLSMNAEDGRSSNGTTRLDDARYDIMQIAEKNAGAALGIFTFSDESRLFSPLSVNTTDLNDAATTLFTADTIKAMPAIVKYSEAFGSLGEYLKKQHELDPTREREVIVLSDFEIYKDQEKQENAVNAVKKLKDYAGGFAFIAYGKDEGSKVLNMSFDHNDGHMKPEYQIERTLNSSWVQDDIERYGFDMTKYMTDSREEKIVALISKPNFALAQGLAQASGGRAIRYDNSNELDKAMQDISKSAAKAASKNGQSKALRQNWVYAPIAIILFVWISISEVAKPTWLKSFFTKKRDAK